jgi:hypothetical protein
MLTRNSPPVSKSRQSQDPLARFVLAVLEETGWVLSGPHGAAARLGLKRSTWQLRLRKLGSPAPACDAACPPAPVRLGPCPPVGRLPARWQRDTGTLVRIPDQQS